MAEKILVVDDEREIADLVALYLKNEGYETRVCYNGQEALGQIQAGPVDLAILDVMLPEISGFELCRRIRERYQYPLIMLTAKGEELDKINGLSLGADDYVTKPFLPLELVARVKASCGGISATMGNFYRKNLSPAVAWSSTWRPSGLSQRRAPVPDAHRVLPAGCPLRKQGEGGLLGGAVPPGLGGGLLHQGQQHHHCAHPASSGKAGGFLRASQVHQNRVGGSAMKWTRKYGPLAAGCLSLLAVSLVLLLPVGHGVQRGVCGLGGEHLHAHLGGICPPRPGLTASCSTSTGTGSSPSCWGYWWSTACCGPGRCSSPASWPAGRKSRRTSGTSPNGCARPWIPMGTPARSSRPSSRRSPPRCGVEKQAPAPGTGPPAGDRPEK